MTSWQWEIHLRLADMRRQFVAAWMARTIQFVYRFILISFIIFPFLFYILTAMWFVFAMLRMGIGPTPISLFEKEKNVRVCSEDKKKFKTRRKVDLIISSLAGKIKRTKLIAQFCSSCENHFRSPSTFVRNAVSLIDRKFSLVHASHSGNYEFYFSISIQSVREKNKSNAEKIINRKATILRSFEEIIFLYYWKWRFCCKFSIKTLLIERWTNIKPFNVKFNLICRTVASRVLISPIGNESLWNASNLTPSLSNSIKIIYHFTFVFRLLLLLRLLSFILYLNDFQAVVKPEQKHLTNCFVWRGIDSIEMKTRLSMPQYISFFCWKFGFIQRNLSGDRFLMVFHLIDSFVKFKAISKSRTHFGQERISDGLIKQFTSIFQ